MYSVSKPTLIINEKIARNNIRQMAEKARFNNVSFEPHFKTHQSKEVGEWFRDEGVKAITVSSVSMAYYFSINGWNNITIAFPFNALEIGYLNELPKSTSLTLLVQDIDTAKKLDALNKSVHLFIEIDTGYHRSGVGYDSLIEIDDLIEVIDKSKHQFKGFYSHTGNTYSAKGEFEIVKIYEEIAPKMSTLKQVYINRKPHIAIGDTPTCSVINNFSGVDSIHPGNFVYYDYTQFQIGSCTLNQIAAFLICPVVAKYEDRAELVIYGGGVHLSKESFKTMNGLMYGLVGYMDEEGIFLAHQNSFVKSISQEHGIISSKAAIVSKIKVGDLIAILPVHSCMTVDCMNQIYTNNGTAITKMDK
jgi:D-serine deaminase-like pyridoxal phosphate-dependent protein